MVSLSNHLHALGDLGFLVHVLNEASEMESIKMLIAVERVSESLIASLSTYFGRLLAFHLAYMISTKASSHDSLLSSWKRKDESANLTALDSVSRPKDSSEVPGFRLERVLS